MSGEILSLAATWPPYVEAVATAVAAVGTVAAVTIALFFQPLREERSKPRLRLERPEDTSFGVPGDFDLLDTVTLRVIAARGRRSAEDVEVLVTASWSGARADAVVHTQFDSQPAPWYRSDHIDGELERMHMAPGTSRRIELFKVGSPHGLYRWLNWPLSSGYQSETVAFTVLPKPPWPGSTPLVQAYLKWHLWFYVTARDVDSVVYETDLKLKVDWHSESDGTAPKNWSEASKMRVTTHLAWENFREIGSGTDSFAAQP